MEEYFPIPSILGQNKLFVVDLYKADFFKTAPNDTTPEFKQVENDGDFTLVFIKGSYYLCWVILVGTIGELVSMFFCFLYLTNFS